MQAESRIPRTSQPCDNPKEEDSRKRENLSAKAQSRSKLGEFKEPGKWTGNVANVGRA